jgi:hypothetical protein
MLLEQARDELRRCSLCGVEKPLSEFHRRGDGHQWWCKVCRKSWDSAYHARTRVIRIAQTREQKRRLAAWHWELKSSAPCIDCGGWYHPAAMGFDHLPGTEKLDEVSDLVGSGRARRAREEVLKCDLVCANCHAVRTYMRRKGLAEDRGPYLFQLLAG